MSLLAVSKTYVPKHLKLVEITKMHEEAHWHEGEAKLQQDVEDWKLGRINDKDKAFISAILRVFTQSDVSVAADYYDNLIPVIKNNEARNMLGSFAGREGVHQRAYALLNDTLGFGEEFYDEFLKFKAMKDKIAFMEDVSNKSFHDIAVSLAKQTLAEGVCLFAIFAALLNYQRDGKLMGMGDINQWSIRDESIHVLGLSTLFTTFVGEHPRIVTDDFKKEIYQMARECIKIEDEFIDLIFETGAPKGITKEELKQYVRSVCDYRMEQLGFKPEYNVVNPFDWLDWITSSSMMENFFETNTTGYSKDSMVGNYAGGY